MISAYQNSAWACVEFCIPLALFGSVFTAQMVGCTSNPCKAENWKWLEQQWFERSVLKVCNFSSFQLYTTGSRRSPGRLVVDRVRMASSISLVSSKRVCGNKANLLQELASVDFRGSPGCAYFTCNMYHVLGCTFLAATLFVYCVRLLVAC